MDVSDRLLNIKEINIIIRSYFLNSTKENRPTGRNSKYQRVPISSKNHFLQGSHVPSEVPTEIPTMNSEISQGLASTLEFSSDSKHKWHPKNIAKLLKSTHEGRKTSHNIYRP